MLIADIKGDAAKAKAIVKKFDKLKSMRVNWDSYWEQLAQYVIPRKDDVYGHSIVGEDKHNKLYDGTSIHSNELLASALHSMMTNPSSVWFGLMTGIKELDSNKEVREWLQDSVNKMIQVLNRSNFQEQIHETYLDLGGIGTTVLRIEEDDEDTVRFHSTPIYESYLQENNRGDIDTIYRTYNWSLRQIAQEFGDDFLNKDEELKKMSMEGEERKFEIIQAMEPQTLLKHARFGSYHVIKEKAILLGEATFNEKPYAVPRWTKIAGEMYGRAPAMKALPDIKMLNSLMKVLIRANQKAADPPVMVPDNGFLFPLNNIPGGTMVYRAGTKDRIEPLVHNARLDISKDLLEETRQRVREAFFIDQLQLEQGPQMTATEVLQRTEEKLRTMSPMLGRLNNELLKPIIDRLFAIMLRKEKFSPMPASLKGLDLDIQYVSAISKAQRASEADTFTRVIQSIAPILEINPEAMQNFNGDQIVRKHAQIFGLDEDMLISQEELDNARKQQAEQVLDAQQSEVDNTKADTAAKLEQSRPE